jgi:hypothetical protein
MPVVPPPPRRVSSFGTLQRTPQWLAQPPRPAPSPVQHVSSGGNGRVRSYPDIPRPKRPEPPVVIKYDKDGRPTLTPDDIPF